MKTGMILVLVLFSFVSAQEDYFLKILPEAEVTNLHAIQSLDDGFVMAGLLKTEDEAIIKLIKTNDFGDIQFSKSFQSTDVAFNKYGVDLLKLDDGGFMLLGTILDGDLKKVILIQTNSLGDTIWTKKIAAESDISSYRLVATNEGGWLIAGFINTRDIYLIKTDFNGNVEWQKNHGAIPLSGHYNVIQDIDSGFVFPRFKDKVKIDKFGELVWQESSAVTYMVQKYKDAFYFVGTNMIKTDLTGKEVETIVYSDVVIDANGFTIQNDDFYISGKKLIKTDSSGITQLNIPLDGSAARTVLTANKDILICGGNDERIPDTGWFIKMNSEGIYYYFKLIAPNGGETEVARSKVYMNVRIRGYESIFAELSTDGGNSFLPLWGELQEGGDLFFARYPNVASDSCLVKISYPDNPSVFDISDRFFYLIDSTDPDFDFIAINQIFLWFSRHGSGSHDNQTDGSGLFWPGGENGVLTSVFQDGFLWGSLINGSPMAYGNTYRTGLIAGNIDNDGNANDPDSSLFKIWKVRNNWQDLPENDLDKVRLENDWNNWPVEIGAPFEDLDGDGVYDPEVDNPVAYGDETNWMVMNALDEERTIFHLGAQKIAVESQVTIYGYDREDELKDVVFKRYKLYNKSTQNLDSTFFTYWSDPDLGKPNDDFVGCDLELNLAYCYNGDDYDEDNYLENPPAVGYLLLQGPIAPAGINDSAFVFDEWRSSFKNISMTSFTLYIGGDYYYNDPDMGQHSGSIQLYNQMNGLHWDGSSIIDPHSGLATKFATPGDPVAGTGWYEGEGWPNGIPPGDRRMIMNSGPFNFAPGDSQEVVYAIIMAQGEDRLDSITKLKEKAAAVKEFYYTGALPTVIKDENISIKPNKFSLSQNYPNPFNPKTVINYQLKVNSDVKLIVYDVLGREVETLVNKTQQAGSHKVTFTASNLASGIYYYKLRTNAFEQTRKMLLLR